MVCKTRLGDFRKNLSPDNDGRKTPKTPSGKIAEKELKPAFKEIDKTLKISSD